MEQPGKLLASLVENQQAPSLQYLIFNKDTILYKFLTGYADVGKQIITDEETAYHLFSITKTFTAIAVLQLAEKEKLVIDEPAFKNIPAFPYPHDITIRNLLTHTAGIPNPIPLKWIHLENEHATFDRNAYFMTVMERNKKVTSKPGERFSYSNLGYVLLGQLIEHISGERYEDYVKKNIIGKLPVSPVDLDFLISGPGRHAKGYQKRNTLSDIILGLLIDKRKYMGRAEGKWRPFNLNYVNGPSYGGLIGTSTAIMAYIREFLKPDSVIISDESKKMLFTETLTNAGRLTGMCFSWFTGELNGQRYFTHAGGGGGYYCEIRVYPGAGIGSAILFNRTGMRDERFLDHTDTYFIK